MVKLRAYFIEEFLAGKPLSPVALSTREGPPRLALPSINVHVRQVGDPADRTLEFIGSDESIDRYDEVIAVAGWDLKNYRLNPVLLFGHDYHQPAIGHSVKTWKSQEGEVKQLLFHQKFAKAETFPFADTIYRLYLDGDMRTVSVGFLPWDWEDLEIELDASGKTTAPRRIYKKQDLLELSCVPVPANPNALVNAMQRGVLKEAELNMLTTKYRMPAEREVIDLRPWASRREPEHAIELEGFREESEAPPATDPAPADAAATETPATPAAAAAPATTGQVCVVEAYADTVRNLRLIRVSPELMKQLAAAAGATVEWVNESEAVEASILEAARDIAKRKAFSALPPDAQRAIRDATPANERIDEFRHPALLAGYVTELTGDVAYSDGAIAVTSGAVLNKRNLARVKAIKTAADEVLAEAEPSEEPEEAAAATPAAAPATQRTDDTPPATPPAAPTDPPAEPDAESVLDLLTPDPGAAPPAPVAPEPIAVEVDLEASGPPAVLAPATPAPPSPATGQEDPIVELDAEDLKAAVAAGIERALGAVTGDVRQATGRRRK